jgi:hypothetical protein
MKKITKLTEEQKAQMAPWAEMWIKKGLCCEPADRAKFERAAEKCYEFAKIPWHGRVIWVGSPLQMAITGPLLDLWMKSDDKVRFSKKQIKEAIQQGWGRYLGGTSWLSWQAYTSFFRDVCHLELPGDLWERDRAYAEAQESAFWWWPHTKFIVACERPLAIYREQRRPSGWGSHVLHNPKGPSIEFRDGWKLYHLHGVAVDADVIERPETLTVERIHNEKNAEVRRVLLEHFGEARYIQESGAKMVQKDRFGELYQVIVPGDTDPLTMVKVKNSTPEPDGSTKDYWLPVFHDLRPIDRDDAKPQELTAHAAVASTFGLYAHEYNPEIET